jgi:hypothetical protein
MSSAKLSASRLRLHFTLAQLLLNAGASERQACVHILSTAGLVPVKQMALPHLAQRAEQQAVARQIAATSDY